MLEVVEVQTLVTLGLLCKGHEEANEEDGNHENDEGNCVLEGAPDALSNRLLAVLGRIFVVLLVVEVGEGHDQQAQQGVERVEGVVDDLEGVDDVVDLFGRGPVLLAAETRSGGRRDESNVDGNKQDGCQQGESREDADNGDGGCAVPRLLVEEDEDGRNCEQDGDGHGIGHPDQAGLYERHVGGRVSMG